MSNINSFPVVPEVSQEAHWLSYGRYAHCRGRFECAICPAVAFISDKRNELLGRLLTLIDATVEPAEKNKAVKDLVRGIIQEEILSIETFMRDQIAYAGDLVITTTEGTVNSPVASS